MLISAGFNWIGLPPIQASQLSNQVTTPTESKALPIRSSGNPPGWPEGRLFLKVFGNEDGLRSGYISCLTFDQRGYLWAGTNDGAAFYDGQTWTPVNMPNRTISNEIYTIFAARDGSLWFGRSDDGLSQLHNGTWTTYTPNNSGIPSQFVRCLYESLTPDGKPCLWVGTDQGLARFQDNQWTVFTTQNSGLAGNDIQCIYESTLPGKPTVLWVGTDTGLSRIERFHEIQPTPSPSDTRSGWTNFTTQTSKLPGDMVLKVLETLTPDGQWNFWIVTYSGLVLIEPISAQSPAQMIPSREPTDTRWLEFTAQNMLLPGMDVLSVTETRSATGERMVWLGTDLGLIRLTEKSGATATGIDRFTRDIYTVHNSNLPIDGINQVLQTPSPTGNPMLWIATRGGGIACYREDWWTTFDTDYPGLPNNLIDSLLETRSAAGNPVLWIGTDENGLVRYEAGQMINFDPKNSPLPSISITSLVETTSPSGRPALWMGTKNGEIVLLEEPLRTTSAAPKPEEFSWTIFDSKTVGIPSTVNDLIEVKTASGQPVLWAACNNGLARYEQGKWTIFPIETTKFLPTTPMTIIQTNRGSTPPVLWIGTYGSGLIRLEETGNPQLEGEKAYTTTSFTPANSKLPNGFVMRLHQTVSAAGHQIVWVGTSYAGVVRLDLTQPDTPWLIFNDTSTPAMPDNTVYEILEDPAHRIYFLTNNGVAQLTERQSSSGNGLEHSILTFTTEDGLPINSCNTIAGMVDHLGRIWVGTIKGTARFDPASRLEDHTPKPLLISQTWLNGQPFGNREKSSVQPVLGLGDQSLDGVNLTYDQNHLVFEYRLVSFFKPSETRYQTQLIGLDAAPSEWSPDTKKEYPALGEGRYVFRVWGRDASGNVTGPRELSFFIKPAPWRTWWAYGLYTCLLVGLGYGGLRWRIKTLQRQNLQLEEKVKLRTQELSEKNDQLDHKVAELAQKNEELARSKDDLIKSYQQAEQIFSALADVLPGTELDHKYRLDKKIGAGGFGAVYQGTHLAMKRQVAVKVFRPASVNATNESLERFKLEAVSTCRVNHPNAVAVLDSGVSTGGIAYLVMELLQGKSLNQLLTTHRVLSPLRCAEIVIPVCNVLAKAHSLGIVHRDIKPDNIFLHQSDDGEIVKVVDFGIAKLVGDTEEIEVPNLTGTHNLIGTPDYMSPERLNHKPYDGRADVYSVGVMAYQMLVGKPPFHSDSGFVGVILQHMTKNPDPLRSINQSIPEAVDQAVLRALEKNPEARPTAQEFARELATAVGTTVEALSVTRLERNRLETDGKTIIGNTPSTKENDAPTMIESDHSTTAIDLSNRTMVMESGPVFVEDTAIETFSNVVTLEHPQPSPDTENNQEDATKSDIN